MALREEMERFGEWLFRWRSYLPLAVLALFVPAMMAFRYPNDSELADMIWEMVCLAVSFSGLFVRAMTVGFVRRKTSGRNTSKGQVADELNTTGIYSVIRHPLYVGNFLNFLGFCMFPRSWWLVTIMILCYVIYYERIILAEEEFLRRKFGREFEDWADRTPAVIPSFRNFRKSELPFCWRTVLKREYQTFFLTMCVFTALESVSEYAVERTFRPDNLWIILFSASLAIYLVLRAMRKMTRLLHVEER
jgi:protein-S-isoprenylcysteine O-methyltransferase Ste14